jgi:hypothetical protein
MYDTTTLAKWIRTGLAMMRQSCCRITPHHPLESIACQNMIEGRDSLVEKAHDGIHPNRDHGLIVDGTAAVEVASFLKQRKRIACPILALRLYNVQVSEQQHWFRSRVASAQHRDKIALLRMLGHGHKHYVSLRQAGCTKPHGHLLSGSGAASRRERRVCFNELAVEL